MNDWNVFTIPKPNGKRRLIEEPPDEIKARQKKLVTYLRAFGIGPGKYSTGFVKGSSISHNAQAHFGKKMIVSMDMKDAFHLVKEHHLRTCLSAERLPEHIIDEVVELALYKGRLPMGGPSSPDLLNIVCKHLIDPRIAGLAWTYRAVYTRYADNIELSSDNTFVKCAIPVVANILEDVGFKLNRKKVYIQRKGRQQMVTGLVVNWCEGEPRARIRKRQLRNFRAKLHNAKMRVIRGENPKINMRKAYGFVAFVNMVDPEKARRFRRELVLINQLRRQHADNQHQGGLGGCRAS